MAALQRHLQNSPYNITYSILRDTEFLHSNQVSHGIFKTLTEMGHSAVMHFKHIESGDMVKLIKSDIIGTHNQKALLNLTISEDEFVDFFNTLLYFNMLNFQ